MSDKVTSYIVCYVFITTISAHPTHDTLPTRPATMLDNLLFVATVAVTLIIIITFGVTSLAIVII